MELGRLRCGKGVSRALKKSPASFWRNRRRIRVGHTARWRVYPLCRQRCGLGLNASTNAFAPGEFDEARRSTRVLASPISHGTHNRAEVATLLGQHILGPRGTHRIEPPLHDAILFERPKALRQCRWSNAIQRVLQILKASRTMLEEVAQDEASPARSNDAECVGHRAFCGLLLRHGSI